MQRKLTLELPQKPAISESTIARAMNSMLISLKVATKDADVRLAANTQDVIQARRDYAMMMTGLPVNDLAVFINETGYNLWTRRTQGRARVGQPVRRTVVTQRGPNMTMCLAVSSELGIVHCTLHVITPHNIAGWELHSTRKFAQCINMQPFI